GLLPICAACKRIRDDNGYWQQIEAYIRDHSQAEFSHAICPECARRLYPDHYKG
ncbi:MAG: sensor with HAMP domain protein, partial [Syntrophobacteraceae bacterium]|nr:sensor with HAMP domain protein [Syntrophobacteraceae bacterium]